MRYRTVVFPLLLASVLCACAHGGVVEGAFTSGDYLFSVTLPGPPYERILPRGALAALTDPATGISFAIAASPDPYPEITEQDKALDYIARDLFFFLEKKEYRVFEDAKLSGVPAKRVVVAGLIDDEEMVFSAVVARHNGAVYDLVMWCAPDRFDTASAVFEEMVGTFAFVRGGGR